MTVRNTQQEATLMSTAAKTENLKANSSACVPTNPDFRTIVPVILVDTREPASGGWEPYFTLSTLRGTLQTGDYSLVGCEDLISIERKALGDLISCFTGERERFVRELKRFQAIPARWVIVEGSYGSLLRGDYRSQMNPKAAFESCVALMVRYQIPVIMAGDIETAARLAESVLCRWFKEHVKVIDAVARAAAEFTKEG
jgi:ERCC4-type nuclease